MAMFLKELIRHKSFIKLTRSSPDFVTKESCVYNHLTFTLKDTGVLLIEPNETSSIENESKIDLILSSGIHGNETAPIEIIEHLVHDILIAKLKVSNRVLFIIGNPPAMINGVRFNEENLNRLFCGKYKNKANAEAKRAMLLESYVDSFYNSAAERCHFDLHTAIRGSKYEKFAIYPFQDGRDYSNRYLNFLNLSGVETILLANQSAATFVYHTSHNYAANAFTIELGKVRPFGQNSMESFSKLITNIRLLISGDYLFDDSLTTGVRIFKVIDEIMKPDSVHFSLNIDVDIENFTTFPIGFQLTNDDNGGYLIRSEEHAIVFPNKNVPIGNRVALIVEKTMI